MNFHIIVNYISIYIIFICGYIQLRDKFYLGALPMNEVSALSFSPTRESSTQKGRYFSSLFSFGHVFVPYHPPSPQNIIYTFK